MLRVGLEDAATMCDGAIDLVVLDEAIDLLYVGAQTYLGHFLSLYQYAAVGTFLQV
jgi:hypothetical protein